MAQNTMLEDRWLEVGVFRNRPPKKGFWTDENVENENQSPLHGLRACSVITRGYTTSLYTAKEKVNGETQITSSRDEVSEEKWNGGAKSWHLALSRACAIKKSE